MATPAKEADLMTVVRLVTVIQASAVNPTTDVPSSVLPAMETLANEDVLTIAANSVGLTFSINGLLAMEIQVNVDILMKGGLLVMETLVSAEVLMIGGKRRDPRDMETLANAVAPMIAELRNVLLATVTPEKGEAPMIVELRNAPLAMETLANEDTLTTAVLPATETLVSEVALTIAASSNVPLVMEILVNAVPSRNVLPATVILVKGDVLMTAAPLVISTRIRPSNRPNSDNCLVFLNP